ncbi:MAG TPA: hypothetical protein VF060_14065 [Trebonia sp.]
MAETVAQPTRYSRSGLTIVSPESSATSRGRSAPTHITPVTARMTNTATREA